jgi:tetratricopeptide (TPR) repeat protein
VNPEVRWLNEEAKLSFILGRFEVGVRQLGEALERATGLGDWYGEIETLNNMGTAAIGMNQLSAGVECHQRALDLCRRRKHRDLEVETLERLMRACVHSGRPKDVVKYYQQSVDSARHSGEREKEIDYLNLLAKAWHNLQEPEKALEPLGRALELARRIGNSRLEGVALNNLGNIHAVMKHWEEAAGCFREAILVFRSLGLDGSVAATQSALDYVMGEIR